MSEPTAGVLNKSEAARGSMGDGAEVAGALERGRLGEKPDRRERGARVEDAGSGKEFELRSEFREAGGGEEATVKVRPLLDLEGILTRKEKRGNRSKANLTGGKRKIFVTNSKKA